LATQPRIHGVAGMTIADVRSAVSGGARFKVFP